MGGADPGRLAASGFAPRAAEPVLDLGRPPAREGALFDHLVGARARAAVALGAEVCVIYAKFRTHLRVARPGSRYA